MIRRLLFSGTLTLGLCAQTLTVEAPSQVRMGEPVTFRVLRGEAPVAGADLFVTGPARETGTVRAEKITVDTPGHSTTLYRGQKAPILSASGSGRCDLVTPAGGTGSTLCEGLDRQPFGQPLGRTDQEGMFTSETLAVAPMGIEVAARSGGETSESVNIEVVFPEVSTRATIAPGVDLLERVWVKEGDGPFTMQALEIDPRHPAVNVLPVRARDHHAGRETTSSMARRYGAVAAVNGAYFEMKGERAGASTGAYVWNGKVVSEGMRHTALVWCEETGFVEQARIETVNLRETGIPSFQGCQPTDIVGAGPRLIADGEVAVKEGEGFGHTKTRNPRTAFAITSKGTMLFVTLDGRQPRSAGMELEEFAEELIGLDAVQAINLDGGGSTTMVVGDQVVNIPSDGEERAVSDALLIFSVPTTEALAQLVMRLGSEHPHVSAALRDRLLLDLDKGSMDDFREHLRAAGAGDMSWQARRLLMEAAAGL